MSVFFSSKKGPWYWYEKGKTLAYYPNNNYEEALKCFLKSLSFDPEFIEALNGKGYALYCMGRYEQSLLSYNKALELEPSDELKCDILKHKAEVLTALGRHEEALKCLEETVEQETEDWSGWNDRGNMFYGMKRYDEAMYCYDRVLSIDRGDNTCGWSGKIKISKTLGNYNDALSSYDRLIRIVPYSKEDIRNKGLLLYNLGRYEESIKCFDKILSFEPDVNFIIDFKTWYNRGDALYKLDKYEESVKCYDRSLELNLMAIEKDKKKSWLNKEYGLICNRKGISLKKLGKEREGIESFKEAIKSCDRILYSSHVNSYEKIEALYEKGKSFYYLEEYETCHDCYNEAISYLDRELEKPYFPFLWILKGNILEFLENYEEALNCFHKALEIDPSLVEGQIKKLKLYDKILEKSPENTTFLCGKGMALFEKGKFKDAIRCYERAIELDSSFLPAWYNKGLASFARGDSDGAVQCYNKALEINPGDAMIWINKGAALYMYGTEKTEEALECFNKAIEIEHGVADFWYKKAIALQSLERKEEGDKCFAKVFEIDRDFILPKDPVKYWYHQWTYNVRGES